MISNWIAVPDCPNWILTVLDRPQDPVSFCDLVFGGAWRMPKTIKENKRFFKFFSSAFCEAAKSESDLLHPCKNLYTAAALTEERSNPLKWLLFTRNVFVACGAFRCLIPADNFYEWPPREGKRKVPVWIHLKKKEPFAFAGLWHSWRNPQDGDVLTTFTIITTDPKAFVRPIHNRVR